MTHPVYEFHEPVPVLDAGCCEDIGFSRFPKSSLGVLPWTKHTVWLTFATETTGTCISVLICKKGFPFQTDRRRVRRPFAEPRQLKDLERLLEDASRVMCATDARTHCCAMIDNPRPSAERSSGRPLPSKRESESVQPWYCSRGMVE